MQKNISIAVLLSLFLAAALLLTFRYSVTVDSIIGFAAVLGLVGIATLEYRINWKRLFRLS